MDELNEKILDVYKTTILNEAKYKVAQNPSDKLWYALGDIRSGGKSYWMPVSSGYKSKKEAESFSKKQPSADKAAKDDLPEAKQLSVPQKHQLAIAKKTLKMSDAGASVMGGMSKKEAVEFLKSIGYSDAKIKKMSEETELDEQVKAKNIKLTFRVWPEGMKPRTYKDLNGMAKDFSEEQLTAGRGAAISLVIGASIIATLQDHEVQRLLDEIF